MSAPAAVRDRTSGPAARFATSAMGSPLRLVVVGAGATAAWRAVRDEFEAADRAMSRFRDDSDLTTLHRVVGDAEVPSVDRRLVRAIVAADRAGRITGGRFDARVLGALERLGDRGVSRGPAAARPDADPASRGRLGVPGRLADRSGPGRVRLASPVDLGGIGKGLALRWAARRLDRLGLRDFLLDAGGDLVARGTSPDDEPWRVGIEDPTGASEPLAVVELGHGAMTTSSIRRRRWVHAGRQVHHLVDPATGRPAAGGLLAVTIAGPDPAWSEVWSKALFIAGARRIAEEARRRGFAAWWVRTDGSLEMTAAARQRTIWVTGEV